MTMASDRQSQDSGGGAAWTVLIVDDEAATRILLRKTVQVLCPSCVVREAADGDAALQIAREVKPDLVLLDIVLPGSDTSGVLVCQELCRAGIKVLIVSGNATGPIADACLAMGVADILRKPFSIELAREKIRAMLSG